VLVGIQGTTISPYLFFWQASQEVEEQRAEGKTQAQMGGAGKEDLRRLRVHVWTGMFASNFIMYFIILTTAATLHVHGMVKIETATAGCPSPSAARRACPYLLFSLGLSGTGMLGGRYWPVRARTLFRRRLHGADRSTRSHEPPEAIYAVIAAAMLIGLMINFVGSDAVRMVFWSAILNGILAPPLIFLIILLTSDRKVMWGICQYPAATNARLDHVCDYGDIGARSRGCVILPRIRRHRRTVAGRCLPIVHPPLANAVRPFEQLFARRLAVFHYHHRAGIEILL
jgi:Mn2+/Fe2+ NRAMP family transporter